jgi:hypothetical protein
MHKQKYIELLKKLYKVGRNSPEADNIRDAMDEFWYAMTPEECKEVGQLSAEMQCAESGCFFGGDGRCVCCNHHRPPVHA